MIDKTKSNDKWILTSVRMDKDMWSKFQKIAKNKGTNATNLLRQLVYSTINKNS